MIDSPVAWGHMLAEEKDKAIPEGRHQPSPMPSFAPHARYDGATDEDADALSGTAVASRPGIVRAMLNVTCSAVVGFVVGAVFWHFVGFWGFVRDVVYQGPSAERQIARQSGPFCTELVLDRTSGSMHPGVCAAEAQILAEVPAGRRSDSLGRQRKPSNNRWSVTVQAESDELSTGSD